MHRVLACSLFLLAGVFPAGSTAFAQQDPDPTEPRPPVLLEMTREERIGTAVQLYLRQFIQAIQQADTVALASLVPPEAIPAAERRVGEQAGCGSMGRAVAMLRSGRAEQSENPALPLGMIRLRELAIELTSGGGPVARADARVEERRQNRLLYAPLSFTFALEEDAIRLRRVQGGVVGLCGLALDS